MGTGATFFLTKKKSNNGRPSPKSPPLTGSGYRCTKTDKGFEQCELCTGNNRQGCAKECPCKNFQVYGLSDRCANPYDILDTDFIQENCSDMTRDQCMGKKIFPYHIDCMNVLNPPQHVSKYRKCVPGQGCVSYDPKPEEIGQCNSNCRNLTGTCADQCILKSRCDALDSSCSFNEGGGGGSNYRRCVKNFTGAETCKICDQDEIQDCVKQPAGTTCTCANGTPTFS
jgi:hypothetical protein